MAIVKPTKATGLNRELLDAWTHLHDTKAAYDAAQARYTAVLDQVEAQDRET
jgi:hypothetical protein